MMGRLSWVTAAAVMLTLAGPAEAQSWRVETGRDPFTDETQVRALMMGRNIAVAVRCHGGVLDALFLVNYIGEDDASIRYRVDGGEVLEAVWTATTSRDGLFAWDPGEVARRMAAGSRMIFEHDNFAGTPHRYTIPLSGSGAAINRVLDACDVPRRDPRAVDDEVWVRAVDDLDRVAKADIGVIQAALNRVGFPVEESGRRTQETYRKLSDFYADYWRRCEAGEALGSSCASRTSTLRYNADADYPKQPIALLSEELERLSRPVAEAPTARPAIITNPTWDRRPEAEFPERALSRDVREGRVEIECAAAANGGLSACTILSESPVGMGFGQSALSGARRARLSPRSVDGLADGGRVRFTVPFVAAP